MAGFKDEPKGKTNDDQLTAHTFQGVVLGDAVIALRRVLDDMGLKYKEASMVKRVFGDKIVVPFMHEKTSTGVDVPYGAYDIEGLGKISPHVREDSKVVPELTLSVAFFKEDKARGRAVWSEIIERTTAELKDRSKSVFLGRALRVFGPQDLLIPQYIDVDVAAPLYLNPETAEQVDDHIYFHIREHKRLKAAGIRTQRGVLLHGKYGTGKSLIAYKAAAEAVKHGRTFVLCNTDMFRQAIYIARFLEPSIMFIEDMDGMGSSSMSALRNLMSGVESKRGYDVLSVLTTNFLDRVVECDRSFMRPERIDAIVEVPPPNCGVIREIIHAEGKGFVDLDHGDWASAAVHIEKKGATAAIVLEMLNRAKVKSLKLGRPVTIDEVGDIFDSLAFQVELSTPVPPKPMDDRDKYIALSTAVAQGEL